MELSEIIKEARIKKNMSQEELAHSLGVSRQAISKWENGIAEPHGVNRELLNQLLELNLTSDGSEVKEELANVKRKMNYYKFIMLGMLGLILLFLIVIVVLKHKVNYEVSVDENVELLKSNNTENKALNNEIVSITFYDEEANVVWDEALWFNMEQIRYMSVLWDGEVPDSVEVYTVPTGTDMLNEKKLIVAKAIESETNGTLIDLRNLKQKDLSVHLSVTLNYGDNSICSETYNVCYYDPDDIIEPEKLQAFDVIINDITNEGISFDQVEWVYVNGETDKSLENVIDERYYIENDVISIQEMEFDEKCTFLSVAHDGSGICSTCTREEFVSLVEQRISNNLQYAYFVEVLNGKIVSIDER